MGSEDVFDLSEHAVTPAQKAVRAAQLGGRYYLAAVPRYLAARRRFGLPVWDPGVLANPARELRRATYDHLPPPPGYLGALSALRDAGARITMPARRLEALVSVWWAARRTPGDVIECGSFRGGTGLMLAVLAARNGLAQRVLLADTFTGIPGVTGHDPLRRSGAYGAPEGLVEAIVEQAGRLGVAERVVVVPGLFAESLPRLAEEQPELTLAFAHVDANVYEGTRDACRFVLPRLGASAAVVFDDYNGVLDLGARLAIDECLAGSDLELRRLAWCSAWAQTPPGPPIAR